MATIAFDEINHDVTRPGPVAGALIQWPALAKGAKGTWANIGKYHYLALEGAGTFDSASLSWEVSILPAPVEATTGTALLTGLGGALAHTAAGQLKVAMGAYLWVRPVVSGTGGAAAIDAYLRATEA